jgi:CO/xanthine dehydrogenase FAD-binding subunit
VDLHSIETVVQPEGRHELPEPTAHDAFLGGGTWLFSEPQRNLRRLIDLNALHWPTIEAREDGLLIGATCTFAELYAYASDAHIAAAPLFVQCCRSLWGSFKIWNTATIGGNLCLALPASPIAALAVALDGICTIWRPDGTDRIVAAADFITGPGRTCIEPGEILRHVLLPTCALRHHSAFRQASLTEEGRSATLLIGRIRGDQFTLTITAATCRPLNLNFMTVPSVTTLLGTLDAEVAKAGSWYADVHGAPDWRRHMTRRFATEIHRELCVP